MNKDDFITHFLLSRASVEFQEEPPLTPEQICEANRKQLDQLRQKAIIGRASGGLKVFHVATREGGKKSSKETCDMC